MRSALTNIQIFAYSLKGIHTYPLLHLKSA
jgi:hypothetical protein